MRKILCGLLFVLAGNAWGGEILVDKAWLRESVPGQDTATLQLNLTVTQSARLTEVSSPFAASVEIQKLGLNRGKVTPHAVSSLSLPRNRTVVFGERNLALMLKGLRSALRAGDHIPINLTIAFARGAPRTISVQAEVRPLELSYKHYQKGGVYDHR